MAAADGTAPTAQDLYELSLEDLLRIEVVSGASKFPQPTTDAPASVSIVTAEQIRRYGYRSLEDILRSVRGLYVSYDRNYSYIGMRGFGRPGDYNTRVLLLIDGHRLNDPVYGQAPIGTDFPIDVSLIDRVEVIRGPGSALYGTGAFFGVINIVTRAPGEMRGTRAEVTSGTLGTNSARASFGHQGGAVNFLVSAFGYRSRGASRLYFPEFDADGQGGMVAGLDRDQASGVFASASFGGIAIRAAHERRDKRVPTASFGSIFGDPAERTFDAHSFVDVAYSRTAAGWQGTARAGYDRYLYKGLYPFDYGEDIGRYEFKDGTVSDTVSGEVTVRRNLGRRNSVVIGGEARSAVRANQWDNEPITARLDDKRHTNTGALYVQDEFSVIPHVLLADVGLRVDHEPVIGLKASPRAALVSHPWKGTAIKALRGAAFRAPNVFERYYYSVMRDLHPPLVPERVTTNELVWEQNLGRQLRTTATVYHNDVDNLITERTYDLPGSVYDGGLYYANAGSTKVTGFEAEIEARWASEISMRVSHAQAHARDGAGLSLSNSPVAVESVNLVLPLLRQRAYVSAEGQYLSSRLTVHDARVPAYYVQNAALTIDHVGRFDFSMSVRNLFNTTYADPGGEEHVQNTIPQDGRTLTIRVAATF